MRRLFERFALVPGGIVVAVAILLVGILCGQADAQAPAPRPGVRYTPPQGANDGSIQNRPEGSRTHTYEITVPPGTTCRDFHLHFDEGSCGGMPGPATAGGGGGGSPLTGWTSSGGIGSRDVTWRQGDSQRPGIEGGGTFSVTITTSASVGPTRPALLSWVITSDGAANVNPAAVTMKSSVATADVYGPKRKVNLSYSGPATPGAWATLAGYAGENEARNYLAVFSLSLASPPTSLGGVTLPIQPDPPVFTIFLLSLNPAIVRNGVGRSDANGEFTVELYIPPWLPSGFTIYAGLVVEDPVTLELEGSEDATPIIVR